MIPRARTAPNNTKIEVARDIASRLNRIQADIEHVEQAWDTGYMPVSLRLTLQSLRYRASSASQAHIAYARLCEQRQTAMEARQ